MKINITKYFPFILPLFFIVMDGVHLDGQGLQIPEFEITHYGAKDGMSSGEKRQIVQDSFGNIWVGSSAGIDRYNGQSFKIYTGDLLDSTTFLDNEIKGLTVTPDGRVWMTSNEGLFVYDVSTDKFIKKSQAIPLPHCSKIPCLNGLLYVNGKLYCGSYLGLYIYDIESNIWEYIDPKPEIEWERFHFSKKAVRKIFRDKYDEDIIYLNGFGFLFKYSISLHKIIKSIILNDKAGRAQMAKDFLQVDTTVLWIPTYGGGLLQLDISKERLLYQFLPNGINIEKVVFAVNYGALKLENGMFLLVFGDRTPIIFDPISKEWAYYKPDELKKQYQSVMRDHDGNIWMAGFNGLTKLSKPIFDRYPLPIKNDFYVLSTKLSKNKKHIFVTSVAPRVSLHHVDNNMHIGPSIWEEPTWDRFYNRDNDILYYRKDSFLEGCDATQGRVTKQFKLERGNEFESLMFHKGNMLVLYQDEIVHYDKEGVLINTIDVFDCLNKKKMSSTCGNVINVANDSILFLYNCSNVFRINYLKGIIRTIPLPNDRMFVKHVFEANNALWVVNKNVTLLKMVWDENQSKYSYKYIFKKDKRTNVGVSHLDSLGQLWICNYNGIKGIDTKTDNVIYNIDGRYGFQYLDAFINETKNYLWVSTHQELLRIPKNIRSFGIGEFSINSVALNGEKTVADSTIKLSYLENNLVIDWNIPYLGSYDAINSYYKVEGLDKEWRYTGTQTKAFLPNLPPGKYAFRVKATADNSSKSKTLLKFDISPPWWKTKWFYALSTVLGLLTLYFIYKRRVASLTKTAHLEKKMAQLEIKALRAQLNPHFIFNCLNSIKALIQKDEKKMAIEYLIVFAVMIRNVLDLSDQYAIALQDELDFSNEYIRMEKLRFGNKFHYSIDVDPALDTSFIEVPPMILQPHIENALWHGIMPLEDKKGILTIMVKDNSDHILIIIDDNGIGRKKSGILNKKNKAYKHNSKGTSLSVDRIKLSTLVREQNIQIDIIDKENNSGTTVNIKLHK